MNILSAYVAAGIVALLLAPARACAQADYERERRWADEITPGIVVGDPVRLELPSGRRFLAIYAPVPKAAAAIIVVHGLGLHPDWGLVNTLRSRLAEQGYATLSVQMPVLAADAKADRYPALFPEAAERLGAAAAWLRARRYAKVAIVSHSMGARMANYFLEQPDAPRIDAWVAIGMPGIFSQPEKLRAPVLDLHGENDYPGVLAGAAARAAALRKVRRSGQMVIAGADHFFAGMEGGLVREVKRFLDGRLGAVSSR
jgi:predicted alpha/beta-hydrolase family hydrolase